jgi:hypothetical protein
MRAGYRKLSPLTRSGLSAPDVSRSDDPLIYGEERRSRALGIYTMMMALG